MQSYFEKTWLFFMRVVYASRLYVIQTKKRIQYQTEVLVL